MALIGPATYAEQVAEEWFVDARTSVAVLGSQPVSRGRSIAG